MHRCWYALARGAARSRASAHEWLEHTVDRELYTVIAPVLGEMDGKTRRRNPLRALGALAAGDDAWLACCARRVAAALYQTHPPAERSTSMDLVDKVFLLQHMDLLRGAQSAHLALVASIADEVDAATGTVLLQRGAPADAAWVVISGSVDVSSGGGSRVAGANDAFGAGALLDASPSLVHAVATSPARLLRIGGDDFRDLLSDHPELAITMLQAIGARLRTLAIDAGAPGGSQPSMYALL
ncbi:MAG TPA: Crp/Fnr family transcriptional regulator [Longimicrobiales bacterium]|nr:Crp/Fnr family transcriptional regulator [Longimicrobiales bacterium]